MKKQFEVCPICHGSGLIGVPPSGEADFEDWGCWLCNEGLIDKERLNSYRTYQGLTELIQRIATFRKRLADEVGWEVRIERDKQNIIPNFAKNYVVPQAVLDEGHFYKSMVLGCCDCSLDHIMFLDEEGNLHLIPERAKGFQYGSEASNQ